MCAILTMLGVSPLADADARDGGEQEGEAGNNQDGNDQGANGEGLLFGAISAGRVSGVVRGASIVSRAGCVVGWRRLLVGAGGGGIAGSGILGGSIPR